MRKKTQLISAFLLRRPLTVIDETLNGIDLEALHLCEKEFRRLREGGVSILLCTHDFAVLERIADRIIFLDLGQLVFDEPTASLAAEHGSLASMVFEYLESDVR
jgi:ABC-2 type transport system ATP-binding protein